MHPGTFLNIWSSIFLSTCRDKHAIPAVATALIHIYEMLKILGIYIHSAKRRCCDTMNLQSLLAWYLAVTEHEEAAAQAWQD